GRRSCAYVQQRPEPRPEIRPFASLHLDLPELTQFRPELTEFGGELTEFGGELTEFGGELTEFGGELTQYARRVYFRARVYPNARYRLLRSTMVRSITASPSSRASSPSAPRSFSSGSRFAARGVGVSSRQMPMMSRARPAAAVRNPRMVLVMCLRPETRVAPSPRSAACAQSRRTRDEARSR